MRTEPLEGFPLTAQQARAWKLQVGKDLPCASAEVRIEGEVSDEVIRQAVEKLMERHEILRTRYVETPQGGVLQVIEDSVDPWANEGELAEVRPEHLVCSLESPGEKTKVLRLRAPGLSMDRGSLVEFFRQLAKLCGADSGEVETFQYADYGQWQSDLQEEGQSGESVRFWSQTYKAAQPEVRLPLEKGAPRASFSPRAIQFEIADELKGRLERLAKDLGAERQHVLLAIWGSVVARVTGRPALPVGTLAPGRSHPELEGALGLFERYLPVEIRSQEELRIRGAVTEVQKKLRTSGRHAELFRWSGEEGDRPQELLFAWHEEVPPITAGKVRFKLQQIQCGAEPFKVKIEFEERGDDIAGLVSFDTCRITLTEANCLVERFLMLLQQVLNSPEEPLTRLQMIGRQEEKILRNLAWTSAPHQVRPVLEWFDKAVCERAEQEAVVCGGKSLSYAELNESANRLANHLRTAGVEKGKPVGLSCERSSELVVGIMGILKAGGAYVPLDPGYPKERLEFMIRDAGIEVLVVQPELVERLPGKGVRTVLLSSENDELRAASAEQPKAPVAMEQLAYIIYTSGSTGQPKGVMIRHENLAISTAARLEYYGEPVRKYLLLSSFAFDSSIAGIFWTLASGGTLILPVEGAHQDPREILALIDSGEVSHLLALPSFYRAIIEAGSSPQLKSLGTVIVAGEACPKELVQQHYSKVPGATLYNEYGPTEGTVWSTVHRCAAEEQGQTVPIGRPVPGMGVYILDGNSRLAGLGVAGEIHITGGTVAPGYLNQPDLTSARFLPSPFEAGERLYRTGDVGRFLENGNIEFLGRTDHQIKIRGYRVEMGEIEEAIRAHENVAEVAVMAREDTPGDQRLVAYIVPRGGGEEIIPGLKSALQEQLPTFMVPSAFVLLEKMPLTPNGKLDRQALPTPSRAGKLAEQENPPLGREEEALAKIWRELLKIERVNRSDNFFELGGHSLLAVQMLARVRDAMKVELPLRTIFDYPTIEGLGGVVSKQEKGLRPGGGQIKRVQRQAVNREQLERWGEDTSERERNDNATMIENEGKGN